MKDFKPIPYSLLGEKKVPLNKDEVLVETAGFVPLDVRMKQMEQQGYIAQYQASDFTSDDLRAIWLDPELEILPGDDLEEIQEKSLRREMLRQEILSKKNPNLNVKTSDNEPDNMSTKVDKPEQKQKEADASKENG